MANLKNINLMSQDTFESIEQADDELYAVSASGIGFPSSRYEDLTLGVSGTPYTAPANGYFALYIDYGGGANAYFDVWNTINAIGFRHFFASNTNSQGRGFVPVKKGDTIIVHYNVTATNVNFRFIYAEGE